MDRQNVVDCEHFGYTTIHKRCCGDVKVFYCNRYERRTTVGFCNKCPARTPKKDS